MFRLCTPRYEKWCVVMSQIIPEEISSPINKERDDAVVVLSRCIADIVSAKQSNTMNMQHFDTFKNAFIRLTNLTLYHDSLTSIKYKKTDKLLKDIVESIRHKDTTKETIEAHVEIAFTYIQELFRSGIISA